MLVKEMEARVKSQVENQMTTFEELILKKLGNIEGELKSTRLSNEKSHEEFTKRLEKVEESIKKVESRVAFKLEKFYKRMEKHKRDREEAWDCRFSKLETSLGILENKIIQTKQNLCSKPEKASRSKAKRKLKRIQYKSMDAKPCENQDPPIDEMKLDQPIQVVQATSMNIASCLAVMVKIRKRK